MLKHKLLFFTALLMVLSLSLVSQKKELSEVSKLRVEIFKLKTALAQCQISTTNSFLADERSKLLMEFGDELGCGEKGIDLSTMKCIAGKDIP